MLIMKYKKLLIVLLLLLGFAPAFSQSVVVNKYQNVGASGDIVELLVVQDNLDLRGVIVKDFTSSNSTDTGGYIVFNNIAFWNGIRAGTLIVITYGSNTATDITTSCTDFNLNIGAANTTYFTTGSLGTGFDIANNDMVMVKTVSTSGVIDNIHTLRAGAGNGSATQWQGIIDGTRTGTAALSAGNDFVVVTNANALLADYNVAGAATTGTGYTFGSGNNANNTAFINYLKGPISTAATSVTGIGFTANWTALTGANVYYIDVSTASDFSSFVTGYFNLNVGNVTSYAITGLTPSTTYYYRVRGISVASTTTGNSCIQMATTASTKTTVANGDWANGAIWSPSGVPASTDVVVINHAVTSTAAITRDLYTTTTINVGASLAVGATYTSNGTTTVNGTFQLDSGGWATGNSAGFTYGSTATLTFNATYTANNGIYWPTTSGPKNVTVTSAGVLTLGYSRTVDGVFQTANGITLGANTLNLNNICQINSGGYFNAAPIYGNLSTLIYNTTGTYGVGNEWTGNGTTVGSGTPQNVTIQNSTTVSMPGSNRGMAGDMTINSGNLTLTAGGDLLLGGNWTRVSTASFTPNNRTVFFSSSITQNLTVSPSGTETFDFLTVQGSGTLKFTTGTNVIVNGNNSGTSGLKLASTNATSTVDLNGQTLTVTGGGTSSLAGNPRKITSSVASGNFIITSNLLQISAGGVAGALSTDSNTIVILQNGLNCGSNLFTIYGTLRIDSGGYCTTNSPKYGSASTLIYNSGGTYGRGFEWLALGVGTIATTAGYPNHVQLINNTNLNYNNGTPLAKAINGNLTIASGSTFDMANGTPASTGDLTIAGTVTNNGTFTFANVASAVLVAGDFTNNGTVTLGSVSGADLKIASNFINTGTFNGNNRAVFFTKTGTQTVSSTTALTIPYVVTTGSGTTVQLLNNLIVSAPLTGNAISFGNAADVLDINGNNLTIGTTAIANVISGSGTFKGSTSSNMTLLGTGSVGTVTFSSNLNLGTFTVNRTTGSVACVMGSSLTVNTSLALTAGIVDLANTAMTIGAAVAITGASSSNYIIADVANGSTAALLKTFSAAGTFVFPIGDSASSADGMQYSPISVTFSGGTYAGYAGFAVGDTKEPNMDASNDYITRYWSMFSSGITPTSYSVTGTYLPVDIFGTESSSQSNQWNGTAWTNGGTAIGSNTMTKTGNTTLPATNHFSAGSRDPEINIQQASTNYLNASTYNFGTVVTTVPSSITFTIQNLGAQTLTLAAATFTGSPNYTYTTAYSTSVTGLSSVTFVVTFNPSGAGTFTGSISISNNDTSGSENPYVINFTGVGQLPSAEINVRAASGGFGNITSGNVTTTNGLQNTAFGSVNLGSSNTKDFEIQNSGTSVLLLTGAPLVSIGGANPGDFSVTTVPATSSIAASSSTTFIITFTPTYAGSRSAIVSIANNDSDENPYTYLINGTGVCLATANTITPTSGPVGTEVTITATTNNLTTAGATFNGTSASSVTQVSSTQIKAIVPSGATSGNLVTTNSQGCTAANAFTVLTTLAQPCEGGYKPTDLFISEFTDSNAGNLSYVELYNGTGVTKNLANYSLSVASNGGAYGFTLQLNNVSLTSGSTYVVALGNDAPCPASPGGDGTYAAQSTGGGSVNFAASGNDHVALFNGLAQIDSWGVFGNNSWASALTIGTEGADFRRNTNVVSPNTTYSNSDWTITDYTGSGSGSCANNDYTNIGVYSMTTAASPTVTQHPVYTPTCKATSLTVAGTEGFAGGNALAYQWYAVAPSTSAWTALTDTGVYSGSSAATLSITDISGLIGYQFYCQIRENSATCYAASNAIMITSGQSTTWNGTLWSNGAPTTNTAVIINGNYDTAVNGSFDACSVTINNGFTVDIKSGNYVSIQNDLTVNASGNLVVENNGSLVMINDVGIVTNNGTTQVIRTTAPYEKYDYTYWSSPVNNASIATTFTGWRTDYSFQFATANFSDTLTINSAGTVTAAVPDSFDDYAPWAWQNYTGTMTNGKGYAIMGPTSVVFSPTAISTVTFSGKVNNGIVSIPVVESANASSTTDDYNLIGNPYPSAVWANKFITDNGAKTSGTLYFWTHVANVSVSNPGPSASNFISDDYAVYNMSGGTRASFTGSTVPTGYIASGQGFFIEAQGNNSLVFNNSMRSKTYSNTDFFRTSGLGSEKDRIWLNLQNADGLFGQLLVAYFDETTLGFDWAYDGRVNPSNNYLSFYSLSAEDKYKIQARPAFDSSDVVPIGYFSAISGDFTISIDQKEGVFNAEATAIYLEDLDMNIIHDLKQSPYTFTTNSGSFDTRFVLRYTNEALATPDFATLNNSVVVATNHGELTVKSYLEAIKEVTVYDLLGRQLFEANAIGQNEFVSNTITLSQQTLIVKIRLEDGTQLTRKIIL